MSKTLKLTFALSICLISACEDQDKISPGYYILNTEIQTGQSPKGFSFKDLEIISYPNPGNIKPDFLLSVHANETGDIIGPMLSQPDLENRFILIKKYDDLNSAQNHFDTLSTISTSPFQTFALDLKLFEIWQIQTNTGEMGKLLIIETRTEKINNTPFAEIKFKADKLSH